MYNAIELFELGDFNRKFENSLIDNFDKINIPIYLSVGTEHIPICIKQALRHFQIPKYNIFIQHRGHSYYLTFANEPLKLALELCGSELGCNKGMGGSASISHNEGPIQIFGHSGLLGDQVPIAVGMAHASNIPTIVILGDAAAEEDYVLGALGFAVTKQCPILFICEDNNLSILTEKKVRRSWNISEVAKGFGIKSYNITDDPYTIYAHITIWNTTTPMLLNVNCERHRWHAGIGKDQEPKTNRIEDIKLTIEQNITNHIEQVNSQKINQIWKQVKEQLPTQ